MKIIKIFDNKFPVIGCKVKFYKIEFEKKYLEDIFHKKRSGNHLIDAFIHFTELRSIYESFSDPLEHYCAKFFGKFNLF